ncbi:MAG: hypothetical protein IJ607_10550 [Bacteroidaceae bacterium]|nr:hypothetical protein [Bacteroidaceae bacterium]
MDVLVRTKDRRSTVCTFAVISRPCHLVTSPLIHIHPYSFTFALPPSSVAEPHSSPSTLLVSGVHCVSVCTNPSTSRLASTSLIPTNVPGVE